MVIPPRQQVILRHVRRYGLTLRPVLDQLFYGNLEGGCDSDLARLREQGLLNAIENAIPDPDNPRTRFSYYQLSSAGARAVGASNHLARKMGGQALARSLAILWFCCVKKPRRHRLADSELCSIFGRENIFRPGMEKGGLLLKGFHALDRTEHSFRVLHLYAPKTALQDTAVELRKRFRDAVAIPEIEKAITNRNYGFAVLAETIEQRDALRTYLAKAITEKVSVLVTRSPGCWKPRRS